MKILVDAHIFDHSYQGTATYIKGLYNALVKYDDIEITICAHNIENIKKHFTDKRFKFWQLQSSSKFKRLAVEYPLIIKKGRFDYAHFQYIVPIFKSCFFINTIHDLLFLDHPKYFDWSYRFVKGTLFNISAKKSDLILTVSEYSKNALLKHYGLSNDDVFITANAVNEPTKVNINIKSKYRLGKFILYVSRFESRKNHVGLLKSFLDLNLFEKGYSLVFIGSKNEKIEQEAYRALLSLIPKDGNEYVRFFEKVSPDELDSFYQNADCFVFPSLAEGFGIPPLEAALNGCKVLCSNQTAMSDFSFFKYSFNPNIPQEFNQKFKEILEDKSYPFLETRNIVENKFNWANIANDFYLKLCLLKKQKNKL